MGINRGSLLSVETHFVSFLKTFFFFIQLEEFRMNKIILIGLFLSVITVELKSIQREKAAGNAEERERQLDQESATFESRDENGEEQVQKLQKLQKMLRIQQAVQEANSSQAKENEQEAFENAMEELMQAEREAADPQSLDLGDLLGGNVKDKVKSAAKGLVKSL